MSCWPGSPQKQCRLLLLLLIAHLLLRPIAKDTLVAGQRNQAGTDPETSSLLASLHSAGTWYVGLWKRRAISDN